LRIAVAVVVALVVGWLLIADSGDDADPESASVTTEAVAPRAAPTSGAGDTGTVGTIGVSGLPAGFVEDLPVEAVDVLEAVEAGGPLPHRQDGSIFFNRERLLPPEAEGYYREYTVETPGSSDRGARRLVIGARGEVFYTVDHYASFVEVVDARV
jgi:ribonuclease T1